MLVSASDWLKLIFEKVCGFAYIKITLSTNLDMHKRFQGSFCCDLPLQDLNLVSASAVGGWSLAETLISPKYLFLSLHPKSKIVGHIKKANFSIKINPLPVFVQKLGTAHQQPSR